MLRAPRKLCSFSYVLFVILLFYVLDVVSITVYDRDTLLNIGSFFAQRKPDFEFQHITINTCGDRVLDHCYSPFRDAYKSLPRPPFGKSDHSSVLLLPAYRQKLKREAPALRTIQCWSDQSDAILQDCFDHVDWDMFRAASDDDIEAYSDSVTCFIRKCVEEVVPTKTIRVYPNQKPWINSDVRAALSARTSAFKSGNFDDRKQASYDLRKSIKAAKRQYKNKVEEQFNTNNARSMWQGINNITDYKRNKPTTMNIAASLPDELNLFYARFEAHNPAHTESAPAAVAEEASAFSISVADVTRSFKRVNIHKAVGPDGIPGHVLRACAFQLAGVFTDIFNLSLSLSVVPSCFKKSTIVPIPKKNKITCLNDWRPVALTPIFSKCFEKLIRDYICSVLPASLDPLQFAYRSNRSTDDAIAFTLHTALSPPGKQECLCEDAFCRLQLRTQYHSACHTGCETPESRTKQISVQLDPGLSDRQKSGGQNGQQHFISADPQHRCSTGLRSQPTPVLPVHT